jgi:hypothetical protein
VATPRFKVSNVIAQDRFSTIAKWHPIAIVDAVVTGVEISIMITEVL